MISLKNARGKHNINLFVSGELKSRITRLAQQHHRTVSDTTRQVILIGLRLFEGFTEAEAAAFEEMVRLTRSGRRLRLLRAAETELLNHDRTGDE